MSHTLGWLPGFGGRVWHTVGAPVTWLPSVLSWPRWTVGRFSCCYSIKRWRFCLLLGVSERKPCSRGVTGPPDADRTGRPALESVLVATPRSGWVFADFSPTARHSPVPRHARPQRCGRGLRGGDAEDTWAGSCVAGGPSRAAGARPVAGGPAAQSPC